jgi:hypothetical protein
MADSTDSTYYSECRIQLRQIEKFFFSLLVAPNTSHPFCDLFSLHTKRGPLTRFLKDLSMYESGSAPSDVYLTPIVPLLSFGSMQVPHYYGGQDTQHDPEFLPEVLQRDVES